MAGKKQFSALILLMIFALSACAAQPKISAEGTALDLDDFITQLRDNGATVELGDQISQPFFDPTGQIINVNGEDVQVFEFPDAASRETVQSTISEDGFSIGTNMVSWIDTPHFWGKGQLIVLYVGSDENIIDLNDTTLNE